MVRKDRKQLGKMFADKFVEKAEASSMMIGRAIDNNAVTIAEVEELDRMRGYIEAMEDTADLLGSTYLYKKLLVYKSQFDVYFDHLSNLYRAQQIIFYPEYQRSSVPDVSNTVKEMVNGR